MKFFASTSIFLIVAFYLLVSSCSNTKYSEEFAQIDSLLIVLQESEKKLNELDTATIDTHFKIYIENLGIISDGFTDKKDDETWGVYTRYGLLRRPLRDFKKNFVEYSNEIEVTNSQLNTLKLNIRKGKIQPELIEKYIQDEASFVTYINISVSHLIDNTKKYNDMFIELNPMVEDIIIKQEL